jgi:hypothetical protein
MKTLCASALAALLVLPVATAKDRPGIFRPIAADIRIDEERLATDWST